MNCAAALVVDTGLHAKGWTREHAVDYLRAQLAAQMQPMPLSWSIARRRSPGMRWPARWANSRFRALRARAQTVLGTRFDIHEFHAQLLKEGAMPLDILEARMKVWMEARP